MATTAPIDGLGAPQTEDAAIMQLLLRLRKASPEARAEALRALDPEFKRDLASFLFTYIESRAPGAAKQLTKAITAMSKSWVPKTDDELDRFIRWAFGVAIPRKAVCKDHVAPFDLLADIFFDRGNSDKAAIGNRGSGKTMVMAIVHTTNSRFKPKFKSATVGALRAQAARCYSHVKAFTSGRFLELVNKKPLMSSTKWLNEAAVEVLTGTISGVNSPHPNLSHLDEFELYRPGVFEEALNMAQAQNGYRAMNVLTSSWKFPRGPVTTDVIEPHVQALREGREPPWQVYIWCVWETAAPCEHDCSACPFSEIVRGTWDDADESIGKPATPRTFESVCKRDSPEPGVGKLKFSDGFLPLDDVVGKFRRLSKRMWEAQQESRRPTAEGLVFDHFDEIAHTVDWWEPDPSYGDIDFGVDFGGTNPHACSFWQTLDFEVEVQNDDGRWVRIPEGTSIMFDEVYERDIGNVTFGMIVNETLQKWEREYPGFLRRCREMFRDPAAKSAAADWRTLSRHGDIGDYKYRDLPTVFGKTPVEDSIAYVNEKFDNGEIRIDRMRCPNAIDELGTYAVGKNGKPVKADDHLMDGMRYRFWGRHRRSSRKDTKTASQAQAGIKPIQRAYSHDHRGEPVIFHPEATPRPYRPGSTQTVAAIPRRRGPGF